MNACAANRQGLRPLSSHSPVRLAPSPPPPGPGLAFDANLRKCAALKAIAACKAVFTCPKAGRFAVTATCSRQEGGGAAHVRMCCCFSTPMETGVPCEVGCIDEPAAVVPGSMTCQWLPVQRPVQRPPLYVPAVPTYLSLICPRPPVCLPACSQYRVCTGPRSKFTTRNCTAGEWVGRATVLHICQCIWWPA